MSKLVVYIACSLDGFIARADGDVSWLDPFNDIDYGYQEFYAGVGSLIMGSKTYEWCLGHGQWPYDTRKSYVVTGRNLPKMEGGFIEFFSGALPAVTRDAKKAAEGKDVWLMGGGELICGFLEEKLVEEIRIFVMPLLLGGGIPLFPRAPTDLRLKLLGNATYPNGVTEATYVPM